MDLHFERRCPTCRTPLQALRFGEVELEECPSCGGVWFDDGELSAIKTGGLDDYNTLEILVTPQVRPAGAEGAKICPSCGLRLRPYRYLYSSPVELDECGQCYGVWVEEGELGKIYDSLVATSPGMSVSESHANELDAEGARARARMRNIAQVSKALSLRDAPFSAAT